MRFHLTTAHHHPTSQETLKDIVGPVVCALRELGHEVTGGHFYAPKPAINILVECFPPEEVPLIKEHRYGIITTERYNGHQMRNPPMWRTGTFKALAPGAEFIWSLTDCKAYQRIVREGINSLAGIFDGRRTVPWSRLHVGYSQTWADGLARHRAAQDEPDTDVLAFGMPTPSRKILIDDLKRRGVTVLAAKAASSITERDYLAQRCRYILGFPATDDPRLISGSRYAAALHAGRPILFVKPQEPPHALQGFGLWAAPIDIPRVVLRVDWRAQFEKQRLWLNDNLPMTKVMRQCLSDTITPELANAA